MINSHSLGPKYDGSQSSYGSFFWPLILFVFLYNSIYVILYILFMLYLISQINWEIFYGRKYVL